MEESDDTVEGGGPSDFLIADGEDVADEHVFEVLGLSGRLAHGEDGGCGGDRVGNPNESLLRDVSFAGARKRENSSAEESECKAEPIGPASVNVHANQNGDSGAEGGN